MVQKWRMSKYVRSVLRTYGRRNAGTYRRHAAIQTEHELGSESGEQAVGRTFYEADKQVG